MNHLEVVLEIMKSASDVPKSKVLTVAVVKISVI